MFIGFVPPRAHYTRFHHLSTWSDFQGQLYYSAYPDASSALRISNLQLRYIDAITVDFEAADVQQFLERNLKITLAFSPDLFTKLPVKPAPKSLNAMFEFSTENPPGTLRIRLTRGKHQDSDALILEMVLISENTDVLDMPTGFAGWLDAAHNVIHDTFFRMIKGDLEDQFL